MFEHVLVPGSSRYIKFLPLVGFFGEMARKIQVFYQYMETLYLLSYFHIPSGVVMNDASFLTTSTNRCLDHRLHNILSENWTAGFRAFIFLWLPSLKLT